MRLHWSLDAHPLLRRIETYCAAWVDISRDILYLLLLFLLLNLFLSSHSLLVNGEYQLPPLGAFPSYLHCNLPDCCCCCNQLWKKRRQECVVATQGLFPTGPFTTSEHLMLFKNVGRRILQLQSCQRVGRVATATVARPDSHAYIRVCRQQSVRKIVAYSFMACMRMYIRPNCMPVIMA